MNSNERAEGLPWTEICDALDTELGSAPTPVFAASTRWSPRESDTNMALQSPYLNVRAITSRWISFVPS